MFSVVLSSLDFNMDCDIEKKLVRLIRVESLPPTLKENKDCLTRQQLFKAYRYICKVFHTKIFDTNVVLSHFLIYLWNKNCVSGYNFRLNMISI